MQMTARKTFVYAGHRLHPGDTFQVRGRSDARTLTAVGFAVESDPPAPTITAPLPLPPAEPPAAAPVRRRTYTRRDLTADAATPAPAAAPAPTPAPWFSANPASE